MATLSFLRGILRVAWRQRGFSATVLLTLGLTTGSALAVFALFDAVFLRAYPYDHPERLVRLSTVNPGVPASAAPVSLYDGNDWSAQNSSFTATALYLSFVNNLTGRGPAVG